MKVVISQNDNVISITSYFTAGLGKKCEGIIVALLFVIGELRTLNL